MKLTAGELIRELQKVPEDSIVRFQWIEEKYIKGTDEHSTFYGTKVKQLLPKLQGWTTYDMPCDDGYCVHTDYKKLVGNPQMQELYCARCEHRNRYITASRCFISHNELFIDGHY